MCYVMLCYCVTYFLVVAAPYVSGDRAGGPPTSPVPQSTNDFLGRFGGRDLVRFKPSSTIVRVTGGV